MADWKHCEGCTDREGCEANGCLKTYKVEVEEYGTPDCPNCGGQMCSVEKNASIEIFRCTCGTETEISVSAQPAQPTTTGTETLPQNDVA